MGGNHAHRQIYRAQVLSQCAAGYEVNSGLSGFKQTGFIDVA
jgi:hypothetical protein